MNVFIPMYTSNLSNRNNILCMINYQNVPFMRPQHSWDKLIECQLSDKSKICNLYLHNSYKH